MATIQLDKQTVEYAVYGGAVLGGGGGGWIEQGLEVGRLALEAGDPKLITVDELHDEDLLVTVALVGAPAAKDKYVKPMHYARALDIVSRLAGKPIQGLITNENGAEATVNGWFQSALTGIPVIDIPCNGRAHPTGMMGAMNLTELGDYVSHQGAVGGKGSRYMEIGVSGKLEKSASVVRNASIEAGGVVAVARNPVTVAYAKQNGSPGAIRQAINVGQALLSHKGESAIAAVVKELGGSMAVTGTVTGFRLETKGGFDVGILTINQKVELTFWNEYMTLEINGDRIASFPDLIMTLDAITGRPVISAAVEIGQQLAVIIVPKEKLILSTTMQNAKLLKPIEEIIGKPI
ncbi:S-methyl thiohydantoin desulfurase domain-containing protein [Paenibacillus glycanilyticus]|uniref:S-methyl thiohydantoin desulfurase domain-containing protein n=1 Tax=Paenibacillus glycanilyticus TaxID=126569 RepID=UPI000FDA416B|nr:DUF917 family protein [Paenibacillus glycanilyticus]